MISFDLSYCIFSESSMQPSAFGLKKPQIEYVLDKSKGSSVNCAKITDFVPHTHSTHTECLGHISAQGPFISEILPQIPPYMHAVLVTPQITNQITRESLESVLEGRGFDYCKAIIVRTLFTPEAKDNCVDFTESGAPYFTGDAMSYLKSKRFVHLLTDLPSVDHETDKELPAHHEFFDSSQEFRTITELCCLSKYSTEELPDGLYMLNLQILNMHSDASPSRPLLFTETLIIT